MSLTNVSACIFVLTRTNTPYGGEFARQELVSTCQAIDLFLSFILAFLEIDDEKESRKWLCPVSAHSCDIGGHQGIPFNRCATGWELSLRTLPYNSTHA